MRPNLHPSLVNGRYGDPAVFVEMLHQRGALLFDLGDLAPLSARDLLRVTHVFVSHTHIDHFIGFDDLLRVNVGREKLIRMFGPSGFCDRVYHKLQAYQWDLAERYTADLVFEVTEVEVSEGTTTTSFRFKNRFQREDGVKGKLREGLLWSEPDFDVFTAVLEHHGPCLGYAVAERAHVNVWKNRLQKRNLAPGQWLQALKRAVVEEAEPETLICLPDGTAKPLKGLSELVTVTEGQKLAYVTDVADTPANRAKIVELAANADTLLIEASFAAADQDQARHRGHLTTTAAGEIAAAAKARRVEPFHFSPRYESNEEEMLAEVAKAFGKPIL